MKSEDLIRIESVPAFEALKDLCALMPEIDPRAVETFLYLLKTSSDLIHALNSHFARHGLSRGRFVVLLILFHDGAETRQCPARIAAKIGVSPATMTGLIDGLESDGLVKRESHPDDGRKTLIRLTPAGRRKVKEILPEHFTAVSGIAAGLNDNERQKLIDLMKKVGPGILMFGNGR